MHNNKCQNNSVKLNTLNYIKKIKNYNAIQPTNTPLESLAPFLKTNVIIFVS